MSYSSEMKFYVEKFDGRINFGFWKVQVKDVLIKSGLHKALKCGMSGHSKRNFLGREVHEKESEASSSNASLILGDDGDLI